MNSPTTWIESVPLWALFLLTAGLSLLSIEFGHRLAGYLRQGSDRAESDSAISSVIGSELGLVALLLAFTFGSAASRFDTRRQLLLDEVNAIGTCYLRAGFAPEPSRTEIRKRLRDYVHERALIATDPEALGRALAHADTHHDELWKHAQNLAEKDSSSEFYALFVDSLNDVINFHTSRVATSQYRIPNIVWLTLYFVSLGSMIAVGYQFGKAGKREPLASIALTLSFAFVIVLIADLDFATSGILQVNQQPMIELDRKLEHSSQ